jgi:hypothetical protein
MDSDENEIKVGDYVKHKKNKKFGKVSKMGERKTGKMNVRYGETYALLSSLEKIDESEYKRLNESDQLDDEDEEYIDENDENDENDETNKNRKNKKKRNTDSVANARINYMYKNDVLCPITGNHEIEMAHIIPWTEDDTSGNIYPLRVDIHRSYDSNNDKIRDWTFHPNGIEPDEEDKKKWGFIREGDTLMYQIIVSKKVSEYSSIKEYENKRFPIHKISQRFIEKAYESFMESENPRK